MEMTGSSYQLENNLVFHMYNKELRFNGRIWEFGATCTIFIFLTITNMFFCEGSICTWEPN
jgi:hypothetical protein